ncbi:hypothetical protein R69619_05433 [Paraburkholderia nemoris]|jgi:uncharacterized membrane protein YwzB|uniref:hypothetical protein n=1 Tax=Paraburkholderia nemoris TaxID=2793076 RepID=UPI00190D7E40|nr:hypothetical protein [Paraburkholderia nemoris]MBK3738158.1 hypothetical protein [Paraburkholderia aspalathi]CAE6806044.1 hypothetical protein R69619_05433 [Paraburkholderia nemoris]
MKTRAQIVVSIVASITSVVGLAFVAGTLSRVRSVDQLHRLLSYDYVSFVDSQADGAIGSVASDFFTGIALILIGSILFTKSEKAGKAARVVAAVLFVFVALSLGYACSNLRIGVKPF